MSFLKSVDDQSTEDGSQPSADVKTVSTILNNFADATTAHGIPRIITRPRIVAKLFWFCLVAFALCIFCIQTSNLSTKYYQYHTNVELVSSEYVEFPAVTICNFNRIKLSKMLNASGTFVTLPEYWESKLKDRVRDYMWMWSSIDPWFYDYFSFSEDNLNSDGPVDDNTNFNGSEGDAVKNKTRERRDAFYSEYSWSDTFSQYPSGDFQQIFRNILDDFINKTANVPNLTKKVLREFGHQAQDFILQCNFNKKKCNHSDFKTFQSKQYGNCFTFDITEKQKGKRGKITRVGSDHGLHLTLFIEQPEYFGNFTEESGVRLTIHPRDILPHPEEIGFSIAPGFSTSIGIRQVELKRLGHPYGECSNGENKNYLSSDKYNYSIISCQRKCLLDNMADKCGCVDNIYDDYDDVPQCQRYNSTQWKCSQMAETNFTTNKVTCDCPPPCHEYIYNSRLSSALWPSEDYQEHLKEKLRNENKTVVNLFNEKGDMRKNLVRVKIYFEELNYELVEQVPTHSVESVLGTVGGLLGLYLGFSLITVCEITVLFYDLIISVVRRAMPFDMNTDIEMTRTTTS